MYRGSVKNIRLDREPKAKTPGRYVFEFTDDYSVFDYGKMPDRLQGKGCAIAMMSAYLFEKLSEPGSWKRLFQKSKVWSRVGGKSMRDHLKRSTAGKDLLVRGLQTHYLGLLDSRGRPRRFDQLQGPANKMLVKAVPVISPGFVSIDSQTVWDYSRFHPGLSQFLIPLENIFRFGVPRGSSLLDRLKKNSAYAEQIGLNDIPREGEWLTRPVLEFSSKLEPMDRMLSLEAALNFSGLDGPAFLHLRDMSLLVAVFLFDLFKEKGLDLWDGKFEFVKVANEILLADSITPDELRITYQDTQLSKEPLRQYYKNHDAAFTASVKAIKKKGPSAKAFRKEVYNHLGRHPQKLNPEFRRVMEQMYQALAGRITGSALFSGSMDIDKVVHYLQGC